MFNADYFPTSDHIDTKTIQHVIDNVYMFQSRYDVVIGYVWTNRTSLRHEDESLFYDIYSCILGLLDIEDGSDASDTIFDEVEEVFG